MLGGWRGGHHLLLWGGLVASGGVPAHPCHCEQLRAKCVGNQALLHWAYFAQADVLLAGASAFSSSASALNQNCVLSPTVVAPEGRCYAMDEAARACVLRAAQLASRSARRPAWRSSGSAHPNHEGFSPQWCTGACDRLVGDTRGNR